MPRPEANQWSRLIMPNGSHPRLSVVIVSYNTRELTLRCLQTLTEELAGIAAEIFVVDNASQDGSPAAITEAYPHVRVLLNPSNQGFGAANNQAFALAAGLYLLLLNSDAFPRPGAIASLMNFLDQQTDVGVVGPRLLNPDGSLQRSCFRFTTPLQAWMENLWIGKLLPAGSALGDYQGWNHAQTRDVDFCIGACLLVRRAVYQQVGGFDEQFFMYQEEADWQKRIIEHGWRVVFTPSAEVVHIAGASGKDEQVRINQHFFDSLDRYVLKHHHLVGFLLLRAAMLVGSLLRGIGWSVMALFPERRQHASRRALHHAKLFARQSMTAWPAFKRS